MTKKELDQLANNVIVACHGRHALASRELLDRVVEVLGPAIDRAHEQGHNDGFEVVQKL